MIPSSSDDETLDKIVATVGSLPAAPSVVATAMSLTSRQDSSISEISRVLSSDQSLAAKVLKLSNSSYYGRVKEVTTLNEAILVLGILAVRSLIVATSAYSMFDVGDENGPEMKLWRHSLSTAVAARQFATHIGHPQKEEIFVAALMHDIGKLVLMIKLPDLYSKVIGEVEENASSFYRIESEVLQFTHCDVASMLLGQWSFPRNLIRPIYRHHTPLSYEKGAPIPPSRIIHAANYMAKLIAVGFNDEKINNLSELDSIQMLGLDEEAIDRIFDASREHYELEMRIINDTSK